MNLGKLVFANTSAWQTSGKYGVRSIITAQATIRYLVTRVALTRFIGWRTIRPTVVK